jgi:hypothetical protein
MWRAVHAAGASGTLFHLKRYDTIFVLARYASLYFVACIDMNFNELITLEIIHMFVETLDRYFGNVCELDIMCVAARAPPVSTLF